MRAYLGLCGLIALTLLAACGPATPPALTPPLFTPARPPATLTPVPATAEEAVLQLLNAEAEGVAQQDIDRLMSIWAEDGRITDANHTLDNPDDDLVWQGQDAIRERYIVMVFPSAPTIVAHPDFEIVVKGDTATVTTTTTIGGEVAPAGDLWTFRKTKEGWKITALVYNLEPP
jgi:ketosteroid isomerase-like protein